MAKHIPIGTREFNTTMPQIDNISSRISELMKKWHVPGLSIAIINDHEITARGFGEASLDPPKLCDENTLFDIASCSKSLTAAAVAILVEDANYPNIKWDSKMCNLLPEDFVMSEESYTKDITIEDILSHRTGLPSHDQSYLGLHAKHPDTPKSITRNLRNLPISAPIRTKFQYCNMMFTVATHLIETVTGQSFESFLHEHFFKPLEMSFTNLQPPAAIAAGLESRLATPYRWVSESDSYRPVPLQHMPEAQGAGQIITSVVDYAKYVRAMMHQELPITKDIYNGVTRPRIIDNPETGDEELDPWTSHQMYAAGWEVRWYRGEKIVQHDGGIPGFGSVHFFMPGRKVGGVIIGNSDEAGTVADVISKELIDEVLDVPRKGRTDWEKRAVEAERKFEEEKESVQEQLCPGLKELRPLEREMEDYVGRYWNVGYHEMAVEIREGKLFVDASDRSMGFYLRLEHVCDQTKFIGHLEDCYDGTKEEVPVQFKIEYGKVVSFGMKDEATYDEYVWYERMEQV